MAKEGHIVKRNTYSRFGCCSEHLAVYYEMNRKIDKCINIQTDKPVGQIQPVVIFFSYSLR